LSARASTGTGTEFFFCFFAFFNDKVELTCDRDLLLLRSAVVVDLSVCNEGKLLWQIQINKRGENKTEWLGKVLKSSFFSTHHCYTYRQASKLCTQILLGEFNVISHTIISQSISCLVFSWSILWVNHFISQYTRKQKNILILS